MLLLLQLQKVASNMHSSITPIILTRFMPAKMLVEAETTNWPGQFWLAFFTQLLVGGWFGVVLPFLSAKEFYVTFFANDERKKSDEKNARVNEVKTFGYF